jgi:hypothetical protein
MLNTSDLLTSIKIDLGIYGLVIPFEKEDEAIINVLRIKTLPVFSTYSPYILEVDMNLKEMRALKTDYQESIYELPDIFGDNKILYIRKITPRNKMLGNGYFSPELTADYYAYNDLMLTQAYANLQSISTPSFTFKFRHPNLLYLYNLTTIADELKIEFALQHLDNFASISNSTWQSFYELALLDVKIFLYNAMKHYTDIQTAYGNFSLKIDEWSNAESERKDLIERWKDVFHLDVDQFVIA